MQNKKILLMLLPFWSPLTPPLGISCLKSFLFDKGYDVKTVDANIEPKIWEIHHKYLQILKDAIPENKHGNLYMVGYDVLMNHLMIQMNKTDDQTNFDLVKELISENFYFDLKDVEIDKLIETVENFFARFETYLLEIFAQSIPDVLGLTVYNSNLAPSLFAFKLIKEHYPEVLTVMGGGTFADQLALNSPNLQIFQAETPYIDKIVVGEGELLFWKLLEGKLPEKRLYTLDDIDGEILPLATIQSPDYSDLDLQRYPSLVTFTSRSCPFQCNFCSETIQWGKYRKKEIDQIVAELNGFYKKYGKQHYMLADSLINPIIDDLAEKLAANETSIYWEVLIRINKDLCDPQKVYLWRKAGLYRVKIGVESGSQRVLDLMDKRIKVEMIKEALSNLAVHGIKTTIFLIVGFPGETEEDFQETLDLLTEMKDYIYEADLHPFYYFPRGQVGSDDLAQKHGIKLLYSEKMNELLVTKNWIVDGLPNREEAYQRLARLEEHRKQLGIPNPYSMQEIQQADQRWQLLHKNAVLPLSEFLSDKYIDENKQVLQILDVMQVEYDEGDFDF